MSEVTSPAVAVAVRQPLPPEEEARADFYALLARLFGDPPDQALLQAIAAAPPLGMATLVEGEPGAANDLAGAWDRLRAASSVMDADAARQEYDDLFVGVGKSEVNLHASHWLTGFMMDKPLVAVRASLAALGLGRDPRAILVEDHLSGLFETMRALVAGFDDRAPFGIEEQQRFFEAHIAPWVSRCCAAINQHPIANYYRRVAELTDSFTALERDSFAVA
jgi:TorA maturation chaperone TorD